MPPTPAASSALLLEEPFIRTPYELMRRSHRSAQRQVEKDFTGIQNLLKSLPKDASSADGKAAILGKLDQASERVKGLKRKLDDLQPSSDQPSHLRARISHISGLTTGTGGGTATPTSTAKDDSALERYIIDYLLRSGRMKAAQAITDQHKLESMVDTKLFAELNKIETALIEKQSVVDALAWCGENRGTLKKTKNNLEFALRLQDFIELCRKRDIQGAIAYSRKYLAQWAPGHLQEIQQGMTLLAFGEKTGVGMYRKLYDRSRWHSLRSKFRETFLALYALPSQPVLSLALSAGLSALRLPSCAAYIPAEPTVSSSTTPKSPVIPLLPAAPPLHSISIEDTLFPGSNSFIMTDSGVVSFRNDRDGVVDTGNLWPRPGGAGVGTGAGQQTTNMGTSIKQELHDHPDMPVGNVDCPTCGPELKVLASECAMSHHVNSTIVCRISGKVMDSENEPMAFPNGYVYSSKALQEMAKNNFDIVTCPRTGESCAFGRLRKVYIS